jgi:hypothetical protein
MGFLLPKINLIHSLLFGHKMHLAMISKYLETIEADEWAYIALHLVPNH